ncbi:hypothetical protein TSMEX_000960 [Taenia solium]|eukprot:TsM_000535100 transcript=TsM_000535100 gene=TsM_000535100
MEDWSSEFEHYLNGNEIHHSLDLPSQVDSILLLEAAIGWHLAAIPELPPLLTFIPTNELAATAISDVTEPYQSNLASHNDLTPLHLHPLPPDEVEGGIRFPPCANSTATVLRDGEHKSEENIRNFSSSDSSKASEACFMSADEGDSFAEELFYDPMEMELMQAHNKTQEVLLELVGKKAEEASLELHPTRFESDTNAAEKPIIYNDAKESQKTPFLDEKSQAGDIEVSTEFVGSPESAFSTEHFNIVDIGKDSTLQLIEQQEARMLTETDVGVRTAEDDYAVNKDATNETVEDSASSPNQLKNDDDDRGRVATVLEVDEFLEEAQESLADTGFEARPSLQLNAGRGPITSKYRVNETETILYFQDASQEDIFMTLDGKKQAGTSEISSGFDKSHDFAHSSDISKGYLEHGQVDYSTESAILNEGLVFSVNNPSHMGNQKASIYDVVSGFDEHLFEESSRETAELVKQQGDFEVFPEGIVDKICFGSEQVCESAPETCKEMNVELLATLNLIFEKESLEDRFMASKFELASYFHGVLPLHESKLLNEERGQAGSSEICCAFHKVDNLSSTTDPVRKTMVVGSHKDGDIPMDSPKTDLISSFEVVALRKPLAKDSFEAAPKTDDVIVETKADDALEASIKTKETNEEEIHNLKHGKGEIIGTPADHSEEMNLSEIPNLDVVSQVEPLKNRVQVGESESVQFFNEMQLPESGVLLLDEKKQAGSFEISSSFVENGEPVTASDVFNEAVSEKNRTHGDESVPINTDTVLSREESLIGDQQKVGSSEIASAFDKEIVEEKSTDITKSLLHVSENKDFPREPECGKAPLEFGTEQTREDELEMSEELCMKEELGQSTISHVEPVMGRILLQGSESALHFRGNSSEKVTIFLDEREQAGVSEMSSFFNGSNGISHSTGISDGVVVESNRADVFTLKISDYDDIIPSQEDGTMKEIQGGSRVKPIQQESVLSIELEELNRNDVPDGHWSVINTDLEPLRDGLKADLTQIVASVDEFQAKKIDSTMDKNVDGSDRVPGLGVSTVHEEPIEQMENPSTGPKGAKVSIDLQPPRAPQGFGIENIDCCNNGEIATVILHPETYSAEYHLPQNLELHTLEQLFNLLEKHRDSEGQIIKGMQQSSDGRMITLSSEIVVSDDSQSEAEKCTVHETPTEG